MYKQRPRQNYYLHAFLPRKRLEEDTFGFFKFCLTGIESS
jgi:hypothetical protein